MKKFFLLLCVGMLFMAQRASAQANAYSFAQSAGTYSAISGGTNLFTSGWDDNVSSVTLPFTFNFNGTDYTTCNVNSNGYITFGATAPGTTNYSPISSTATYAGVVSPFGRDLINNGTGSQPQHTTLGTAPNRTWVLQWQNARRYNLGAIAGDVLNFQIRLNETTNIIEIVYGTCTATSTGALTGQVGLRGATNSDFNNRTTTTNWSATTAGATNSATCTTTNTIMPASGLTFTYTPPTPCAGTPSAGTIPNSATVCNGSSTTLAATGFTTGQTGISFQWEESLDNVNFANATGGSGATTTTYTTPAITGTIYYRLRATCANGGGSAVSNSATIGTINCSFDVVKSSAQYSSISGSGNSATGWRNGNSTDDNLSTAQPIGFTFPYKGGNYTEFSVSTNGFLTFNVGTSAIGSGTGAYGYSNSAFSSTTGTLNALAPFYEDLVCQGNPGTAAGLASAIKYSTTGSAPNRVLTVEWVGMETFGNPGPNLNFQVKLYETSGAVEFAYGTMELFNGTFDYTYSYTVGINAASISGSPTVNELQCQQVDNVQNFSNTAQNSLLRFMDCNASYLFVPGTYSGAAPSPGAPSNDEAAGAIALTVNEVPCVGLCGTYYTSRLATASAGIAACSAGTPGTPDDDVWFRFTATASQQVITVRGAGGYNLVVQLLDNAFTPINCVNATATGLTETISATGLTPGAVYFVRVYHSGTGTGTTPDFSICVNQVTPPPANDDICGAVNLNVGAACVATSGSTLTATASAQAVCGGTADDDVWYKFTALTAADVVTAQSASGFNAHLQVFSSSDNTCTGTLTSLACLNNTSTGGAEVFTGSGLTAGNTYFARVYHTTSGAGTGNFTICATASAPACATLTAPAAGASVEAANGTTLTWNAVNGATAYDVYFDGNNPPTTLVSADQTGTSYTTGALAANQVFYWQIIPKNSIGAATGCTVRDFNTNPPSCVATPTSPADGGSVCEGTITLSWPASAGATGYDVYVDGSQVATNQSGTTFNAGALAVGNHTWQVVPQNANGLATGCATWAFSITASPAGNTQATAIVVSSTPYTNTVNTSTDCFTNNYTTSNSNGQSANDVFYVVTTGSCADSILIGHCGSGMDTYVHLLDAAGVEIAFNDDNGPLCAGTAASLKVNVDPNTTYYIVSEGYNTNNGNITTTVDFVNLPASTFYADADGDGFGNPAVSTSACTAPAGYVADNTDCNDGDNSVYPGAPDNTCNGIDNDCDGSTDEDATAVVYYADADGDGLGDPNVTQTAGCTAPTGFVDNDDDCDDSNASLPTTFYADADNDNYGASGGATTLACTQPAGFSSNDDDCNDNNASINPGAAEICGNGTDENCDGSDGMDSFETSITPSCKLPSSKNIITISNVVGGTAPYTYSRNGGSTYQSNPVFNNLLPGTYTMVVKDATGCTISESVVVNMPMVLVGTGSALDCYDDVDGTVSVAVSLGYPDYDIQWFLGPNSIGTGSSLSGLGGGTYKAVVTDQESCTASVSVTVVEPPKMNVKLTRTNATCFGANDGSIANLTTGGVGNYTFYWEYQTDPNDPPIFFSSQQSLLNLGPAVYTVTATDANGCAKSATQTVKEPKELVTTIKAVAITCNGANNGSLEAKASGGTGTKTFVWSTGATTALISNLGPGTYTVTVKDANNCQSVATATVAQPAPVTITNIAITPNASGSYTVAVSSAGGTAPRKAQRTTNPPTNTIWGPLVTSGNFTNVPAGTYLFRVVDKNGCSVTQSQQVPVPIAKPAGGDRGNQTVAQDFTLTPNPARGSVQLSFIGEMPTSGDVEILDAAGKLIKRTPLNSLNAG
ncbi:MAG: beta strand repeat-containing protein, partial [Saprospiraceae bacterium]